jgi:formate dehydrogenase beta subunit
VVPRELEEALEEGIEVLAARHHQPLIMKGSHVTGAEIVALRKLPGGDGRKHRISFEGTERVIPVDMVIPCVGEKVAPDGVEAILRGNYLWPNDNFGRLEVEGVYALGDARGDRGTVAAAIGDGRRAIRAIAAGLRGAPDPIDPPQADIPPSKLNLGYYPSAARHRVPKLPPEARDFETEIEGPMTRNAAFHEAERCLSCGNCLACDNCWTFCPDSAVIKTVEQATDGSHYLFDLDYCKGCGLCATECPTGYIQMVENA